MQTNPLVTIGIPNYNYGQYIIETLDSVANQSYSNIELIIIDDKSTDNSIDVIENWIDNYSGNIPIIFIKNERNIGLTISCNVILKNATGTYFQPLDADDRLLPDKIKNQVAFLQLNTLMAMVYANVAVINDNGIVTNPDYCSRINYDKNKMPSGKIFEDLLVFNFISLPSVLIKTSLARLLGGFDESLLVQDYFLWLSIAKIYDIGYINEVLAEYRVHSSSMSNLTETNIAFEESVMRLKYRYFKEATPGIQSIIATNIQNSSVFLYENRSVRSKEWLTIAFKLKPGIKTGLYYCSIRLGIPFSFFKRVKSINRRN